MQMQQDLLKERDIFRSEDIAAQQQACNGLRDWIYSPQPLRLLVILNKIGRIGA